MTGLTARAALTLFWAASATVAAHLSAQPQSSPTAQIATGGQPVVQPISIRVDAPARVGFPIWVHADLQGALAARYPFGEDPRYLGSNRLELKRDGQILPPQPGYSGGGPMGLVAGSIAPASSPQNRLPLHVAFAIDRPGRYAIRWTVVGERFEPGPPPSRQDEILAESNWLDFEVVPARPTDHEAWLTALLAARPTDAGAYVGDYLPSLLAAAPDRRVAQAVIDDTYTAVNLIASCALGSLGLFPAEVAVPLTLGTLHQRGPSSSLAYFVSWHAHWFQDRRDEIVSVSASFLRSNDDAVVEGALQMLGFARAFDWRDGTIPLREAERAVEAALPSLVRRSDRVAHALAIYLPGTTITATRDRLWQLIEQRPAERQQALIALTWIADPRDLVRIAELLLRPGDKDPRGTDLAGLADQLIRAYGETAIPYLQRALAESPYVWVRTHSAEELVLKGRVEAFRFFLDAITANRSYRPELENWLRRTYRLPANDGEPELLAFLNERIRDPKPPPAPEDSPVRAAVAKLQSADASERKAAAQALLDLAPQSPQYMSSAGAYLLDDVIRKPGQVNADTWRDAALILGRLRHRLTVALTLYLERDGATAALIDLGEPAVPAVTDVLKVGGPPRRRLAAEVLGAIGGAAGRDALSTALKMESDVVVRSAIETALSHVGQHPSPAEIR